MKLKTLLRVFFVITVLLAPAFAQVQRETRTISASGGTAKFVNTNGAMNASFEELISGTPDSVSIALQGCMLGSTCTTLETNTSTTAGQIRTVTGTVVYDYFLFTASWVNGSTPKVVINSTLTTARGTQTSAPDFSIANAVITPGADATLVNAGVVRRQVYKATVTGATCINANGFIKGALTADCVIATIPAKTEVTRVFADVTQGFTCSGTCTGTKVVVFGKSAGGTEYLLSKSVATPTTLGLINSELGAALINASSYALVGGGDLPSWSSTTTLTARFTSGTGFWGNGSATFVNAGSITFYIETLQFP